MNKYLEVGQEVWLSPETEWDIGTTNPLYVRGVVTEIDDMFWVHVTWDNGSTNAYQQNNYDLMTSPCEIDVRSELLKIVCEDGILNKDSTVVQGIVDRILDSGLLKEI